METPLRIAVCEDMQEDAELLLKRIAESDITSECRVFTNGKTFMEDFIPGQYDLIFLDIYVGDVQQGVDIAAKIRETDNAVTLAFTTFSKEHALEGYRLKVFAYLEKPVRFADVQEVLEHAFNKRKNAPAIELLIDGKDQEILLNSILYFEQRNHVVFVNTLSGTLRTSQTVKLRDIESLLPNWFLRCHQSYIANLRYVAEVDRELRIFRMQNGDAVYIRRPSLGEAVRAYEDLLFTTARGEEI